ncbi:MAG TPA: hypothetical protein VGO34_15820 [Alphaproteobacteria bacterium]|jgi:hypothetical protein
MNKARSDAVANRREGGRAAGWLSFVAAPTFALMASLTALHGEPPDMLCASMRDAWPLGGMVPMYLLMGAFHATPWLRLLFSRGARRP